MSTVLCAGTSGMIAVSVVVMARANQPAGMERENRAAASMHDPARRASTLLDRRPIDATLQMYIRPMSRSLSAAAPGASRTPALLLAELRALIVRHARRDETTAIDGVLLSAAGRPGEPEASTTGTVMALIAQGAKRLAIGDRTYDYGPGQYLVASVDLPITGHYTHASADGPALGFGLVLQPAAIADCSWTRTGPRAAAPRRARPAPSGARRRRRGPRAP